MKVQARIFVIVTTLFIFLPVTWIILREVRYRMKHGNTPIEAAPAADTTHKDTSITKH